MRFMYETKYSEERQNGLQGRGGSGGRGNCFHVTKGGGMTKKKRQKFERGIHKKKRKKKRGRMFVCGLRGPDGGQQLQEKTKRKERNGVQAGFQWKKMNSPQRIQGQGRLEEREGGLPGKCSKGGSRNTHKDKRVYLWGRDGQ